MIIVKMKSTSTIDLEDITRETIDEYAQIRSDIFGQIILESMGYVGVCTCFCKCKDGGYNIGLAIQTGYEFMKTFSLEEIMESFSGKVLDITTEVTKK